MEVIFTFGSSEKFPYQNGYISINAGSLEAAIQVFRNHFPDKTNNTLNCSEFYWSKDKLDRIKAHGNLGIGCYKKIDVINDLRLYDFLMRSKRDFDTADEVFDASVTACYIEPDSFELYKDDSYYQFTKWVYENVKVIEVDETVICDWSGFVEEHMQSFRKFSEKNWKYSYPDNDDFVYEWVKEINSYLAGCVSDKCYKELLKCLEEPMVQSKNNQNTEKSIDDNIRY